MAAHMTCKKTWTALLLCAAALLWLRTARVFARLPGQVMRRGLQGADEEPYRDLDPPFTACSAPRLSCCTEDRDVYSPGHVRSHGCLEWLACSGCCERRRHQVYYTHAA